MLLHFHLKKAFQSPLFDDRIHKQIHNAMNNIVRIIFIIYISVGDSFNITIKTISKSSNTNSCQWNINPSIYLSMYIY